MDVGQPWKTWGLRAGGAQAALEPPWCSLAGASGSRVDLEAGVGWWGLRVVGSNTYRRSPRRCSRASCRPAYSASRCGAGSALLCTPLQLPSSCYSAMVSIQKGMNVKTYLFSFKCAAARLSGSV
jgi:hypothetical protein